MKVNVCQAGAQMPGGGLWHGLPCPSQGGRPTGLFVSGRNTAFSLQFEFKATAQSTRLTQNRLCNKEL